MQSHQTDHEDAEAVLSLRWANISFCWFVKPRFIYLVISQHFNENGILPSRKSHPSSMNHFFKDKRKKKSKYTWYIKKRKTYIFVDTRAILKMYIDT